MILTLPNYVPIVFICTTALTLFLLYKSTNRSLYTVLISCIWLIIQGIFSSKGFFLDATSAPPRIIIAILPPLLLIVMIFILPAGRKFAYTLDPEKLSWIHIVRVPVEVVLFWLFTAGQIPELMTFEGRNFDILSGLTAPLIIYFGFIKRTLSHKIIIGWNFICLILLLNVVINGIFAAPTIFQQQAFDQPNVAVLKFPFIWLPCFIVPVVMFSHLVVIRKLIRSQSTA